MKPCPNCKSTETYVADRCGYVICRKCGMTGPVAPAGNDEEAEKLWDGLPRTDEVRVNGFIDALIITRRILEEPNSFGNARQNAIKRVINKALGGSNG